VKDDLTKIPRAQERHARLGLASRVLLLTAGFVMLAEIAIYIPSIANFRNNWLRDRLASARTAALVFEAAPIDMVPERLTEKILESVGAQTIVMKMHGTRRLLAASAMPPRIDETFDLRDPSALDSIAAAGRALVSPPDRILDVIGNAPMGADFIEITLEEGPLKEAMQRYSINILLLSLVISAIVACLAVAALHLMVLRPVRHLTSSLMRFGENPEDASRIIVPSGRDHEIGRAEEALAVMQTALARELAQKKHLAALGLAVAKINHDLRNMLSSAQLLSDRLSTLSDPTARRLAPKLVGTLDRAIRFCQTTLAYGRAVEHPPEMKQFLLRPVAADAAETVVPSGSKPVTIRNEVPDDLEIMADPEQIFRVLMNLIRNAVEALEGFQSGHDGPATVTIGAERQGRSIVILVRDTGPGVPMAVRGKLFDAFQNSTRTGGSGLGLSIAADLVRAHGGTIELAPDQSGATFRIQLPDRLPVVANGR
jgi:signal transduction histidine kinase